MIVWQGFGFLVLIVAIAALALMEYVVRTLTADAFYYNTHGWPKLVAFWIAAAAIYGIARFFESRPGRVMTDKQTGQQVVLRQAHSLFFVPMKYWTFVFLALGLVIFFTK